MTDYWTQVGQISSVVILLAAAGALIGIIMILVWMFAEAYRTKQYVRGLFGIAALAVFIIFGGAFGFWLAAATGVNLS